jgi:lipopolysaccharide export system permease protein
VYGRMAGANEVVAVKALGISPMALLWPGFILALVLSLLTVYLNELSLTWGQRGVQRVVIGAVEEIVYGVLRTQRSYSSKSFSINVKGVEGRRLLRPTFSFMARGDKPAMTVMAAEAEIRCDDESLQILCREGLVDVQGQVTYQTNEFDYTIPLSEASRSGDNSTVPSRIPQARIPQEVARIRSEMQWYAQRRSVEAAVPLLVGDFETLAAHDWQRERLVFDDWWNHLNRLATEPPRRWSNGFSCLCFVLLGAPWAIWRRNADFMANFMVCFAPILLLYYPLLMLGVEQAKSGAVHPYIVWLGNVALVLLGLWVLRRRVIRY